MSVIRLFINVYSVLYGHIFDLISCIIVKGDCDFERGTCGWVDTSAGTQMWMQGSNGSSTANMGRGPAFDHTLGNSRGNEMVGSVYNGIFLKILFAMKF